MVTADQGVSRLDEGMNLIDYVVASVVFQHGGKPTAEMDAKHCQTVTYRMHDGDLHEFDVTKHEFELTRYQFDITMSMNQFDLTQCPSRYI